ncbi:MAG: DMT family transporter [Alphaproteobacteria bacterium]
MVKRPKYSVGVAQMAAAMVLSGTLGYFVLESHQSAYNVVFFRCLFGAISLALYCWVRGLFREKHFNKNTFLLALGGGVAIVANWVLLFSSYKYASISISTAVYHTQPFFLIIFGMLLFRERPGINKMLWFFTAFIGLFFVINIDMSDFSFSFDYVFGLILALSAAVLYAIATIIAKRLKGIPPHLIALAQVTLGVGLLLPFVEFKDVPLVGPHWVYLISLGVIHTCIMYILMYSAFQKLQTPAIAVLSFIYPAVAILVDYVFYNQNLATLQIFGILLILLGGAGVNLNWSLIPLRLSRSASS